MFLEKNIFAYYKFEQKYWVGRYNFYFKQKNYNSFVYKTDEIKDNIITFKNEITD